MASWWRLYAVAKGVDRAARKGSWKKRCMVLFGATSVSYRGSAARRLGQHVQAAGNLTPSSPTNRSIGGSWTRKLVTGTPALEGSAARMLKNNTGRAPMT